VNWSVRWSARALKDADALDRQARVRVFDAIDRLASGDQRNIRRLHGGIREYRLRVGDWRVLFSFDRPSLIVDIDRVLPRGRAYRR
jgi:mRNA interferase RelE/StbE